MNINLLFVVKVFLSIMFLLYWYLLFQLIDKILEKPKLKKIYRLLIGIFNAAVMFSVSQTSRNLVIIYIVMFFLILVEFYFSYKDRFVCNLFCTCACIIHVLTIRMLIKGIFSMLAGYFAYRVSNQEIWITSSLAITYMVLNFAIATVLRIVPLNYVRIINEHKEQQWFMIAWMSVNNIYLFINMGIFNQSVMYSNMLLNEIVAPLVILIGLYIVLFFAVNMSVLLGYKEKNVELEQEVLELQYKSERDPLTGVYNKEITGEFINEHLKLAKDCVVSVLFMIDVDNFKEINDQLGHVYGDAVLCELGDKLQKIFRSDDIVGRIGGDEYIAYMKNGASTEIVKRKAEAICKAFCNTYIGENNEKYMISGSVGISFFPKDGKNFEELYQRADSALYQAKNEGKNTYVFYDGSDFAGYKSKRTDIQSTGSIYQKSFRQNRIEYVFKMLYQSENYVIAIRSVLGLVASHFSFERGYIFETDKGGKTTSNTFEWCADGVAPLIRNLQNIPIEIISTVNHNFYKNGTFVLKSFETLSIKEREFLETLGIKSMFQFGIFDKNSLLGFIGFDNGTSENAISDVDLDEMTTICNILATFFVKQHIIEEFEKIVYVEELTGGRTYHKFKEDAQKILEEQTDIAHFIIKFDIDNFKLVNKIYGYEKGDDILRCVAEALIKTMRDDHEIFARVTNDEFIAIYELRCANDPQMLYEIFLHHIDLLIGKNFTVKLNFPHGIYIIYQGDSEKMNVNDIFEKVNIAHKAAKLNKTSNCAVYNESMTNDALHKNDIENKMENALAKCEFLVYLQPKYVLDNGMIGGAEALVRWKNEREDLFLPGAFIPVFESNGFIIKLDEYMLRKVCEVIKCWIEEGIEPVTISVNFSRLHLSDKNFVKKLCEIVDSYGIDHKYIDIEITETVIYDNAETLDDFITELHSLGFTMSMDDFGSGYSSLGLLKNLSFDVIKMDRSFFVKQKDIERSKIVVGSIIEMAAALCISIVAEGVEEKEQIDFLRELHCDMAQGYYFARPMPVEEFSKLIKQ